MELAIRLLFYAVVGLVLVVANLWFVRSVYTHFLSTDYVIAPFNVLDPSGHTATDKAGEALAQMLASQLANIQAGLEAAQTAAANQPRPGSDPIRSPVVTTLFVSRAVDIPTGLFQPVEIDVSVGGVEVSGLLSWVQRTLAQRRVLTFTTYEKGDRSIVSADLAGFARSGKHAWFESDTDPDEIATNAAYALIQRKLADKQLGRVESLELADFRALLETVFEVERLNRLVAQGYVVEERFAGLLSRIELLL